MRLTISMRRKCWNVRGHTFSMQPAQFPLIVRLFNPMSVRLSLCKSRSLAALLLLLAAGQTLRADGYATLAGLEAAADPHAEALRLRCTHIWLNGQAQACR